MSDTTIKDALEKAFKIFTEGKKGKRKPLLIINNHPAILAVEKEFKDQSAYYVKLSNDLKLEANEKHKELWNKMHDTLITLGYATEEQREDVYEIDDGIVYEFDKT